MVLTTAYWFWSRHFGYLVMAVSDEMNLFRFYVLSVTWPLSFYLLFKTLKVINMAGGGIKWGCSTVFLFDG